ncbi:DNA (cytosine-5-)-methyltransferase [Polyangium sp. y55x31]|uniref:DNA cytosine methyltransferase n=1 Tax=Polyangium sp. y55x31 TaxID=3042688 RepID=UPI0032B2B7E0
MRVAGLFAGIGGLELGLAKAGHEASLLCEIEPGARAVLQTRLPEVRLHDDICSLPALPAGTELVAAGFPCQDLSQAGKTVGIEGTRSGLVGEVFRLLRGQPIPWVLLENVPFMLQLARGRAMDVIVSEFERLGYRWAYRVVNSRAFGLPQRRERVIFLASLEGDPREVLFADDEGEPEVPHEPVLGRLACGFYWTEGIRGLGWAVDAVPTLKGGSTIGIPSPPAIVLPDGMVVTPNIRDAERMQGFDPSWTEPTSTVTRASHRWKLVGNAVTVEVAQWVGNRLRDPSPVGREVDHCPLRRTNAWPKAAWNVGEGRFGANLSAFPVQHKGVPLHEWLQFEPAPLSAKATAGFLSRAAVSSLRFPAGFLDILEKHLRRMERAPSTTRRNVVQLSVG